MAANANASSDTPPEIRAANVQATNLKEKAANQALQMNSLANANCFANEVAKISLSFPCEWTFATKFASECECDSLVHSGTVCLQKFSRLCYAQELREINLSRAIGVGPGEQVAYQSTENQRGLYPSDGLDG